MKKKKIWLWNHYATDMYRNRGGRHYWFAKNLIQQAYEPTIFCASTIHNSDEHMEIRKSKYSVNSNHEIPFVFVNTPTYSGNGRKRIKNMMAFYRNLFPTAKEYAKAHGKPDVILASSVHPLTLVAGIKIAKKLNIPCICEVRDLWPESIVAYDLLKRDSIIAKILYKGEKWIYKRADSIIMTIEGGKDYIIDQGWDHVINIDKIKHINNGLMLDTFIKNSEEYEYVDPDLENNAYKNIVYAGSIRKVNNVGLLLDAANIIQAKGRKDIRFLIFGSGNESEMLKQRCEDENINNVLFKGRVEKKYIPSILKKSYVNILHNSSTSLDKYGQSQNKLFEYMAAGRCIVQTYNPGYNICEKYHCGFSSPEQNAEEIAKTILKACSHEKINKTMGENAYMAAQNFDYTRLTSKLIEVIENV